MSRSARRLRALFLLMAGGSLSFPAICLYKGNERFYKNVAMPGIHQLLDAESAHSWAITMAKWGLVPRFSNCDLPILKTQVFGQDFPNPIGLAGGFDKDAEAVSGLFGFGFGFIEVGSITPNPQEGNFKPRIFRLTEDNAIINRCGFNSKGHEYAVNQLKHTLKDGPSPGVIGISLGKNRNNDNATEDYVKGVNLLGPFADYLVVNVSSPNTPGLRQLQEKQNLEDLLKQVLTARDALPGKQPPVLIKLAPDLSSEWKQNIAEVVMRKGQTVDGLIVSNTTTQRPSTLKAYQRSEVGGLSGTPLKDLATSTIRDMYTLTKGTVPIIGVGGVSCGADAYEKIRAGASLVQVYTVLAFEGPPAVNKIKRELQQLLQADGYSSVSDAVGTDNKV